MMNVAPTKSNCIAERTKIFSLAIINLFSVLPKTTQAQVIGKQLLRSATSVGAQY
jgi:four helix bundle protein